MSINNYKCLVTGGAGFIGSHLVKNLLKKGYEVACLDNLDSFYDVTIKRQNIEPFMHNGDFSFVEGSILDKRILRRCMKDVDYVFHMAAKASVSLSMKEPIATHRVNATGTLKVLDAANAANVKKVINISSSAVYGKVSRLPMGESHHALTLSFYGASKICAENYCEMYAQTFGMDIVSLRYFNVYGPSMRPDLAISLFTNKAMKGEDITIFGNGAKSRDFIYIDDVIDATTLVMKKGSGVYNIGSGEAISIKNLAEMIIKACGSTSRIVFIEGVAGEMQHTLADTSKAKSELGFEARITLEEGIERYMSSLSTVSYTQGKKNKAEAL